ncbi:hypothetical protein BDR06DRAFT_979650 [Suillus hirtellus]|nr:hypothetical protein BDR06DRAFT_979650 [Suillus hirtellus]
MAVDGGAMWSGDDSTYKLSELIKTSTHVQWCEQEGAPAHVISELEHLLQKKQNQWQRWSDKIIPSLITPYLVYIWQLVSLQCTPDLHSSLGDNSHCDGLQVINLSCCKCSPVPLQLMMHGLFACAPVAPSLAVDICVLELVNKLFAWMTPNSTAWCEALETFLNEQGYKLNTKDSLRWRFSNVYHWYAVLTIMASDYVTKFVYSRHPILSQPSTYLRSHCLLCFGGNDWVDCVVCVDACFTQKCSNNPRNGRTQDPPNPMPTVFVPKCDVKAMEDHVSACRRGGAGTSKRPRQLVEEVHNSYKKRMRIPVSVLDGCSESFVAADEKRQKASTHFFADTGLMALLCHHDQVLWLINMTSPGEKQHYALALVKQLFEHLPPDMMVGLLYDIGCQLKCSCRKWSLLDDSILSHISFGISRVGFGLSDREGCEHLWSALKHLISVLRVLGWMLCQKKKQVALEGLTEVGIKEEILREEWAAQVAHQTKPLAHKSKNKAAEAIAGVLMLEKTLESYQTIIHDLERRLINNDVDDVTTFNIQLDNARARYAKSADTLVRRCTALVNELNLRSHTETSIKRREPMILKIVSTYNMLCDQLYAMIRQCKAPPGAIAPLHISCQGIFQLDVDNEIWQDVGLEDEIADPPPWLTDNNVCHGICLLLDHDRCVEEENRLSHECCVM